MQFLNEFSLLNKQRSKNIVFADNYTVAGTVHEIKAYWDILPQTVLYIGITQNDLKRIC